MVQSQGELMKPFRGAFGRWVLVNSEVPCLAWTGSSWDGHREGIPIGASQICNFESEEEALTYRRGYMAGYQARNGDQGRRTPE